MSAITNINEFNPEEADNFQEIEAQWCRSRLAHDLPLLGLF